MKLFYISAGIILLLLGIGTAINIRNNKERVVSHKPTGTTAPISNQSVSQAEPSVSPSPNPISLPALAQKDFNGRDLTLGKVLDDNSSYTRYYITYKSGDLTISGIMNKPKGDGPFPVLILNHGYIDPKVYTNGRGLKREQDYLAKRGYVVVHPDYRNHADSSKDPEEDAHFRMGYIEDVINAVKAVQSANMPYINKEKIGMLGHSMGGGITLGVLVTQPDLVKAAVLFAPVSASAQENYEKFTDTRPDLAQKVVEAFGSPDVASEFWKGVSPQTYLSNIKVPIMVHHGTSDTSTPIKWSDDLHKNLKELGKDITYYTYPGEPHEFINAWPTVMDRTTQFFDSKLK